MESDTKCCRKCLCGGYQFLSSRLFSILRFVQNQCIKFVCVCVCVIMLVVNR
jgi:hypothetical protein